MLEQMTIRNFVLIENLQIDFATGFNVITGETGAGKSIILGALNILMGDKADASVVRLGAEEATISASIDVPVNHPLNNWLKERGLELEEGSLLLRRTIRNTGRGSIYVQSTPMTRMDLHEIGELLFDMHGQHEHQSLLSPDRQRRVLDSYGDLLPQLESFNQLFHQRETVLQQRRDLVTEIENSKKEEDYLRFVAEELKKSDIKPNEDTEIQDELLILSQYESIHASLECVRDNLRGPSGEGSVGTLHNALGACRKAAKADPSLDTFAQRLESLGYEIDDIYESIRDRLESMSFSENRLDELQGRLALLQRLKKKYGPSLSDVIAFRDRTLGILERSECSDGELAQFDAQLAILDQQILEKSKNITERRKECAGRLQEQIASRLIHLGMPHVVFSIAVEEKECSVHGADLIEFRFSANLGEPMKSLREIASGGELSRVMLAIKTVLAEADDIETLVFDEVDAGIGGAVAIAVGDQMRELSQSRQVIAITHLASIAAKADQHLVVFKDIREGRTFSGIMVTQGEQRVLEIARMLSGDTHQDAAIAHARQLLAD